MEAMACALPVIATPVTGIPELVRAGETGLLVEERDEVGLADALELLIVDVELRQRLGQAARQTILNEFEIQQNVAKLAAIFQRIGEQRVGAEAGRAVVQA
jgi:glycosyltransferase involved in cell wall biosynthesis